MTLSIYVSPTLPDVSSTLLLASLPLSTEQVVVPADADLQVLDGTFPLLPDLIASEHNVVVNPGIKGVAVLDEFVLDSRWSSNPAVPELAKALEDQDWQHLEVRAILPVGADLPQATLELLSLTRAAGFPAESLRLLTTGTDGITGIAVSRGRQLDFAVTLTDARQPHATVRALTPDGDVSARIPDPITARPAEVSITNSKGTLVLPSLWESGHRAAWRRVLRGGPTNDAPGFAEDVVTVKEAFNEE